MAFYIQILLYNQAASSIYLKTFFSVPRALTAIVAAFPSHILDCIGMSTQGKLIKSPYC